MILKDISFSTPAENIHYDEVLLQLSEKNPQREILRLWESSQDFIVLGCICDVETDVNGQAIEQKPIPILRRASGGGTVLQGPGCLNYSLILSKKTEGMADLRKSYDIILHKVVQALAAIDVDAMVFPISDIALSLNHKKISGNAQKRGRHCFLHHGTLLYDYDLKMIEQYLRYPPSVPQYRDNRDHSDFIVNIKRSSSEIKKELSKVFNATLSEGVLANEQALLDEFLITKKSVVTMKAGSF